MSAIEEFRPGIYRHYKGPLYQALFLAHDANADDLYQPYMPGGPDLFAGDYETVAGRVVVVYIACELDQAHTGVRPAVRTLEDWNAWVYAPDPGSRPPIHEEPTRNDWDAGWRPRFEYVGVEYQP